MATCITNCNLLTHGRRIRNQDVAIQADRVIYVGPEGSFSHADRTIDLKGRWLSAGLIDLQVNGAGGALFQESITTSALDTIAKGLRSTGVTSFLPTLTCTSDQNLSAAIEVVNQYRQEHPHVLLGINFEGPFINPEKAGMADAAHCRKYDSSFRSRIVEQLDGRTYITCAPEAMTTAGIADLRAAGAIVAIGHTTASVAEAHAFLDSGCQMATHLFNAMTGISGRDPGVAGAVLTRMDTACSLIADSHHIHMNTARLVHDAIGVQRIALISDGMPPIGSDVESFRYGQHVINASPDGKCLTEDGVLAGTAVGLSEACRNFAEWLSVDVASVVPAATSTPAGILNLATDYGSIKPGMVANFAVSDAEMAIQSVIVAGDTSDL
jgi:N-acetylglucosamine-6-phosphate deacetylase